MSSVNEICPAWKVLWQEELCSDSAMNVKGGVLLQIVRVHSISREMVLEEKDQSAISATQTVTFIPQGSVAELQKGYRRATRSPRRKR